MKKLFSNVNEFLPYYIQLDMVFKGLGLQNQSFIYSLT